MKPQGRLGDPAFCLKDSHWCPVRGHPVIGPAIQGSSNVQVNSRPALRDGDPGIHGVCCGPNTWKADGGSSTVIINGRKAFRRGDRTKHCGGTGKLVIGSSNVLVGDNSVSPQVAAMRAAAQRGTPFCEECERKRKAAQDEPVPDPPPEMLDESADEVASRGSLGRVGDLTNEEIDHIEFGDYTPVSNNLTGGAHTQASFERLKELGYVELSAADVKMDRDKEKDFAEANEDYKRYDQERKSWKKRKSDAVGQEERAKDNARERLKNTRLSTADREEIERIRVDNQKKVDEWKRDNPAPLPVGKPKPEAYGLSADGLLSSKEPYFYREPLGRSGAEIGGVVPAKNSIHSDGHTWFPPGWDIKGVARTLQAAGPGVAVSLMLSTKEDAATKYSGTKYTAWLRRANGTYEVAPPGTVDPASQGYLKSSLIQPADGSGRTVFPEMTQSD